MGEILAGGSVERDGVGLEEWLWRLFDEDGSKRAAARDFLYSMMIEIPDGGAITKENIGKRDPDRFYKNIESIADSPAFETEEFLVALGLYHLVLSANRLGAKFNLTGEVQQPPHQEYSDEAWTKSLWKELRQSFNESTVEISKRIVHSTACGRTESELNVAEERLRRWMAYFESPEFRSDLDGQYVVGAILLNCVLPFLRVPEMISVFMESRMGTGLADKLLIRYGSAASWFAAELLHLVQFPKQGYWIPTEALGVVGRNDSNVAGALLEMIRSDDPEVQERGLAVLKVMGPELGHYFDEILKRILELQTNARLTSNVAALASVGRKDPEIRAKVLEMAKPRPPRIVKYTTGIRSHPEATCDLAMFDRGPALEAIRYFVDYPDEAVPVLIEALESFEEYDEDMNYFGDCARISASLEAFGPAASSAAFRLAEIFRDGDHQDGYPKTLLQALVAMGPSASAALQILEPIYQEQIQGVDESFEVPDEFTDPLGWVIYQIKRGK
ncbi:MAG: hypothetical protein KDA68_09655 [Planctomycetaceae bacterium]|nr:hypothetical protein [Planctomycetaceae bacterium]